MTRLQSYVDAAGRAFMPVRMARVKTTDAADVISSPHETPLAANITDAPSIVIAAHQTLPPKQMLAALCKSMNSVCGRKVHYALTREEDAPYVLGAWLANVFFLTQKSSVARRAFQALEANAKRAKHRKKLRTVIRLPDTIGLVAWRALQLTAQHRDDVVGPHGRLVDSGFRMNMMDVIPEVPSCGSVPTGPTAVIPDAALMPLKDIKMASHLTADTSCPDKLLIRDEGAGKTVATLPVDGDTVDMLTILPPYSRDDVYLTLPTVTHAIAVARIDDPDAPSLILGTVITK